MRKINLRNILIGILAGFVLGFMILHPFSMLFQGMIHPTFDFDPSTIKDSYSTHHLPMAIFFGLLGTITGLLIVLLLSALSREKEKVKVLEGLLRVCAWCKKIQDEDNQENGSGKWVKIEQYIKQRSDANFTHGICPECYAKEMKKEEEKENTIS